MSESVTYRATERCFVDGALREPGAVFRARRFDSCPAHLKEVAGEDPAPPPAKRGGPKAGKGKTAAGATAEDMGVVNGPGVPPEPGEPGEGLDLTGLEAGAVYGEPD
jgi:hypothetical protein